MGRDKPGESAGKELTGIRNPKKLLHEGALAKMSGGFAPKKTLLAQGAKLSDDEFTQALDKAVASCKRVVAEQDETAGRYRQVLLSVRQLVGAHVNGKDDE